MRRKRWTLSEWTDLLLGITGALAFASVLGIFAALILAVH